MKENHRLDIALLILRIGLGVVVLFYGMQKMFGAFGGAGYSGTISFFTTKLNIPPAFAHLSIAAEFFGALGALVGFLTPVAAFGLVCNFAFATFKNMTSEPDTLHKLMTTGDPAVASRVFFTTALFFMSLALLVSGPGRYSVDARVFGGRKKR